MRQLVNETKTMRQLVNETKTMRQLVNETIDKLANWLIG